MRVLYERCAAVDVGKDVIAVAARLPGDGPDGRQTVKRTYKTFYGVLREAVKWLMSLGVTHVAMEATGIYSMPVYHALLEHGDFGQVLVCNAGHVKNVPGRKTDLADAQWLAQLLECGLLAGSFIPPAEVKAVRDVIRYRAKIARQRVSEISRLGNVLQDAGIKIDSVASSIATKSGRAMIEALIDGERRGQVLANLAKGKMRSKIPDLSMALEGRSGDHHAMLCRLHLDHLDHLDGMIAQPGAQAEAMMQPFRAARDLLVTIPGTGPLSAAAIISEIGTGVREFFPDAAHLASWAGLCPGNHESAGRHRPGRRRPGNKHLQPVLVECAWAAIRHDGYLKSLFHRHVMKNGGYRSSIAKSKAIITVAHAILVITWHVLATGRPYDELGADYFDRRLDPERETRRLVAKLEALGHRVSLEDLAALPASADERNRVMWAWLNLAPCPWSLLGPASGRAGQGARSARGAVPEASLTRLAGSRIIAGAGAGSCRAGDAGCGSAVRGVLPFCAGAISRDAGGRGRELPALPWSAGLGLPR